MNTNFDPIRSDDGDGELHPSDWARTLAPELDVVTSSAVEPALVPGDLLAVFDDTDAARELVLAWERIEAPDRAVGFVALGRSPERPSEIARPSGVDPEGVTTHAGKSALAGAVPGAIIGALLVGAIVAIISGWTGAVWGGVLGGAAFGAVAGGVMVFVKRTGWGDAYEHSYVDPDATELAVVSFHSEDPERIERARDAAREADRVRLATVTSDGEVGPLEPQ